ncbi:hypothetical protein CCY99_02960 [Helicobacter sp. 16-1353]|uniref:type II secretion system protein n=1 Tax=Helicobacter sp. 16-1353 TaxID=2004996 RepID=UPI000DCC950B|nr:prepilin-type N-terminal cleavage/methylation domain-containing protein [Helicobacter sp. 16-1353]RAX54736.1 hypothetical protein CCY99_02960 [Helicobacter sp. 16-1353]
MKNVNRSGFSMIELVFVIVILGVLAAVAVPRFVTTRTDAQVAMARSDIATVLKAIPARVFAENIDPTSSTAPDGFSTWGEWMIDTGGMDKSRWAVGGNGAIGTRGIQPLGNVQSRGGAVATTGGCGAVINIDTDGNLIFDPKNINLAGGATQGGNDGVFCKNLRDSYPSNSNRIIPLATTGAVKF